MRRDWSLLLPLISILLLFSTFSHGQSWSWDTFIQPSNRLEPRAVFPRRFQMAKRLRIHGRRRPGLSAERH